MSGSRFKFEHAVREPGQFAFKAGLTFDGLPNGDSDFLPDNAFKIARAAELALDAGRAYLERVAIAGDCIFLIKEMAQAL
jgi:hypothetical protein